MTAESSHLEGGSGKKSRKIFPAFCRFAGTFLLIIVIAAFLPLTVPGLMGYKVYEVVSGSMAPEIPVGSAIYVKGAEPEDIRKNDIIVFQKNESVITHRVVENHQEEKEFVTKGDANRGEDMMPVTYYSLIGKVGFHIPFLGKAMTLLTSTVGKIYAAVLAIFGVLLRLLAGVFEGGEKE